MHMRTPKRVRAWKNPEISPDDSCLWAEIETDDGETADLEIPLSDIGQHVAFLVSSASFANADESDEAVKKDSRPIAVISVEGLGFSTGTSPNEAILMVRFAGQALGLSLNSNKLAEFGKDLARTAELISAGGRPQ